MKTKIFIFLMLISLLSTGFGGEVAHAADEPADPRITIYVVPALTNEKILPTTAIPDAYISDEISITASAGEYEPASFVIRALDDISSLEVEATELTGDSGSIPSSNIDIRVVKCWYQAGVGIYDTTQKLLTPELLLKDDSLVKVEDEENYLRLTSGEYVLISDHDGIPGVPDKPTISEFPVQDNPLLQPVDIAHGINKQFWVTVKVPDGCPAGTYAGIITLSSPDGLAGEIQLNLEVLPIQLLEPYLEYGIMYFGTLAYIGTISENRKNEQQYQAEMSNLIEHGITYPTADDPFSAQGGMLGLGPALDIRNETGMVGYPLYYCHWGTLTPEYIGYAKDIAQTYGVPEVILFANEFDECGPDRLDDLREFCDMVHGEGGKVFIALSLYYCTKEQIISMADAVDIALIPYEPDPEIAAAFHIHGNKVVSYSNPQGGEEKPETYRRNYGLLLWQKDYDGTINCAYHYHDTAGHIWNDFDGQGWWRPHNFTYPTIDGVIDTIQWEGFREGVEDVRYLTTLLESIEEARGKGKDTSAAEAWLANLKRLDLTTTDLDVVRSDMINYILSLQTTQNRAPVLASVGSKIINEGELLTFTISATDPDGDSLTYSASNLPSGATFNATTQTFSWMPDEAGTYPNIHFEVSDGEFTDSEDITITVNAASPPPPPSPPEFKLDNLSITPGEVDIGEEITISVVVTNAGDAAGSCLIVLEINGVTEATKEITVDAGATEEVSFTIIKNNAGIYVVDVNGLNASFIVKEAPTTIVEEAPATEISVFSVTPSYDTETHRLAFARIIYEVNNLRQPTTDVDLTLKVSLDGEPVEELSLLPPSWLDSDRITDSQDYIPPQGWRSGTYTFQVELSVGGELYATAMEELEVTAASATPTFSWATLGKIIGATLILIAATVSAILLRRRHLLQRLGQR